MSIADELQGHFDQLYAEIEITVKAFPDALWRREEEEGDLLRVPAFMAHHAVSCMALAHLFNIPSGAFPDDLSPPYERAKTPSQDQVLKTLDGIRRYTKQVYGSMPDDEYLEKRGKPHVPLGAVAYALAHGRHHLGQLTQVLRANGVAPPKWYPLR